ncbi:MAG: 3-dehydroquinate synthase [Elusimicrobiota bacterium]
MKTVKVHLQERSYDIVIGSSKERLAEKIQNLKLNPSRIFIVTTNSVAKAGHLKNLILILKPLKVNVNASIIPDGEAQKNITQLTKLFQAALRNRLDRKSLVIALGGGVVTDMAGFLAATYMRGVPYISVPTTLLAMVDASIGGKTGIDLDEGKNLVGAFWQPKLVFVDPSFLKTLSDRDWKTGFAEIIKYGLIKRIDFFRWLERKVKNQPHLKKWTPADVFHAIYTSALTKAQVVSGDERETPLKGGREILNFGHTIGHALEAATGYKKMTHGEAISVGMGVVGDMSVSLGLWDTLSHRRMIDLLKNSGLPVRIPSLNSQQKKIFWNSLQKDKKHVSGSLRFVLPLKLGAVQVQSGISILIVKKSLHKLGF